PWNSVAVDSGVGRILHFGCEIVARMSEKVLAVREGWANDNLVTVAALIRALANASAFADDPRNAAAISDVIARRLGVASELVMRSLTGRLTVASDGTSRASSDYMLIGRDGASRPDPVQAAWLYAQIARWGQAPLLTDLAAKAQGVFRPDLYDAALGSVPRAPTQRPRDGIGAFAGPDFAAEDPAGYLNAWAIRRPGRPRLSIVN
ncbi:MAG: ABC transporter substrate-binding protein, partial [Xanthobacteraceae bacterium]